MKDTERRRYETFLRVREHGASRTTEFPMESLAGELFNGLGRVIEEIDAHTRAQASSQGSVMEGSTSKAAARDQLRRDMEAISRTARAMAMTVPGLEDKFRSPRSVSDQDLLVRARAFAADALPLKAEFIRRGLPDNFLDELLSDVAEFEQAVNQKMQAREAQVAATAGIDDAIERGVDILRELDAIMRNKYANDPVSMAAWLSASHTERSPRHAAPPQPNPAPPTP